MSDVREVASRLVQRINENPDETCPFCETVRHPDGGADHDAECIIQELTGALGTSRDDQIAGIERELVAASLDAYAEVMLGAESPVPSSRRMAELTRRLYELRSAS